MLSRTLNSNLFHIMLNYLRIKENPSGFHMEKHVYVFGAKAAPSYEYAKRIIELILAVAAVVNNDKDANKFMKIMPIFSFIICMTVSAGVGIYWAVGAAISWLTTVATNAYYNKVDMEKIILLEDMYPVIEEDRITGMIETLDVRFGSLWTNI